MMSPEPSSAGLTDSMTTVGASTWKSDRVPAAPSATTTGWLRSYASRTTPLSARLPFQT